MNINSPLIFLKNVYSIYEGEKRPTINDINLTIEKGEFIYIIGPNASGKTTLLETINGLIHTVKGAIKVFGLDLNKNSQKIRKRIAYMLQTWDIAPNEPFLVKDIVMMGRSGKLGVFVNPKKEDWEVVKNYLDTVGMLDYYKRPIGKLSGGEQQKIFLAKSLAQEAPILMLDEPFSNLDTDSRKRALEILKKYKKSHNATILIVSHFLSDVSFEIDFIDRILLMQSGSIIKDGPPKEILQSNEYQCLEKEEELIK
ncbi:MAG: ATP-binding cassette domain-containing protein [Candidatus Lokiarchaeota archaeon]|nr:ATP-binding cassette domain-containing protein [Candidatus Lokiarchaeota archaeon]